MDNGKASAQTKLEFANYVRNHASMLTVFLRASGIRAENLDDLFQEVFIAAWARFGSYERARPFGPWLRGIASNKIGTYYRKYSRRPRLLEANALEQIGLQLSKIEEAAGEAFQDKLLALRSCVTELSGAPRKAIELHYWKRRGVAEIAKEQDCSVEAAKKRLQRARAAIFQCMRLKYQLEGLS